MCRRGATMVIIQKRTNPGKNNPPKRKYTYKTRVRGGAGQAGKLELLTFKVFVCGRVHLILEGPDLFQGHVCNTQRGSQSSAKEGKRGRKDNNRSPQKAKEPSIAHSNARVGFRNLGRLHGPRADAPQGQLLHMQLCHSWQKKGFHFLLEHPNSSQREKSSGVECQMVHS